MYDMATDILVYTIYRESYLFLNIAANMIVEATGSKPREHFSKAFV